MQTTTENRRRPSGQTIPKVGMESSIKENAMRRVMENNFKRRRILTVPDEILAAHPDKHFVYLNMNTLEKNGMWDENGYELFKVDSQMPSEIQHKLQKSPDGLIHRNEMVLAWIPEEEYQIRQMEKEILRGSRNVEDIITKRPELAKFHATAKITSETQLFPKKEELNG